jgi:hypothetical protein
LSVRRRRGGFGFALNAPGRILTVAYDFSKHETQKLFEAEVKKRMERYGMSREQAEMLVAVLMRDPPAKGEKT